MKNLWAPLLFLVASALCSCTLDPLPPPPACQLDEDCPPGMSCQDGQCVAPALLDGGHTDAALSDEDSLWDGPDDAAPPRDGEGDFAGDVSALQDIPSDTSIDGAELSPADAEDVAPPPDDAKDAAPPPDDAEDAAPPRDSGAAHDGEGPVEICDNSRDDDGDGRIDCDDDDCALQPSCLMESSCDDGVDNDGNGLTDCDDPTCVGLES